MTFTRRLLASLATIATAAGLMVIGTVGDFTADNAGITTSKIAN